MAFGSMGGPMGSMGGPMGSMGGPMGSMGGPMGSMGGPMGSMGGEAFLQYTASPTLENMRPPPGKLGGLPRRNNGFSDLCVVFVFFVFEFL